MKLLSTETSDIAPVASKNFQNYSVDSIWNAYVTCNNIQLLLVVLLQKVQSTTVKKKVK